MTTITFACPECQTYLKTSQRISADQDVRCPKCGTVFPVPAETDLDFLDDSDMVKPGAVTEKTWNRPDYEGTDRADKEVRGSTMAVTGPNRVKRILLASALVVVLFTAGTAFLAWRTIENWGRNEGTGREDPLAFVPAGSTLVLGVDLGALADHPDWADQVEKGLRHLQHAPSFLDDCKTNTGIEFRELFDQVILAFKLEGLNPSEPPHVTVIAHSKVPFNQNRIRDAEKNMYRQVAEGKTYYQRNVDKNRDSEWLFMPSDRILILSSLPVYEFETLLEKDGSEPLMSADEVRYIRGMQSNPFWAAFPFSASIRQNLARISPALAKTDLAPVLDSLKHAKVAGAFARWEENKMVVTLNVECESEDAARLGSNRLQQFWDKHFKVLKGLPLPLTKELQGISQELADHAQFSPEASTIRMTARITPPTPGSLEPVARQISNMLGFSPSPIPQPVLPPGFNPPPGRRPPRGFGPGGPPQQPPPGKV